MDHYRLFIKKLVLAFFLGFLPVFLTSIAGILENVAEGDKAFSITTALIFSVISGALAAGLRAVLATFTDWMPSDRLHGIGDNPGEVVVTKES